NSFEGLHTTPWSGWRARESAPFFMFSRRLGTMLWFPRLDPRPSGALMAARSLASLTIAFGMVSIPVKLYSATQAQAGVSFNLLHRECGSRLEQPDLWGRGGGGGGAPGQS